MTPICPSCATVSACPAVQFTERDRRDLVEELTRLREQTCALDFGHASGRYERVCSLAQGERLAEVRREEWSRTGLGRLLAAMGGAA